MGFFLEDKVFCFFAKKRFIDISALQMRAGESPIKMVGSYLGILRNEIAWSKQNYNVLSPTFHIHVSVINL